MPARDFFGCYLLTSKHPSSRNRTYIGFTVNPQRRIRQHNGLIANGAHRTKKWRPWDMTLVVYGFPTQVLALQFEWAWQHPARSLTVRSTAAALGGRGMLGLKGKMRLMLEMLHLAPWCYFPLTLQFLSSEYGQMYAGLKRTPSHISVVIAPLSELPECVGEDEEEDGSISDVAGEAAPHNKPVAEAGDAGLLPPDVDGGGEGDESVETLSGSEAGDGPEGGACVGGGEGEGAAELAAGHVTCAMCEGGIRRDLIQCACGCTFHVECMAKAWILEAEEQEEEEREHGRRQQGLGGGVQAGSGADAQQGWQKRCRSQFGEIPERGRCPACQRQHEWLALLGGLKCVGWGGAKRTSRRRRKGKAGLKGAKQAVAKAEGERSAEAIAAASTKADKAAKPKVQRAKKAAGAEKAPRAVRAKNAEKVPKSEKAPGAGRQKGRSAKAETQAAALQVAPAEPVRGGKDGPVAGEAAGAAGGGAELPDSPDAWYAGQAGEAWFSGDESPYRYGCEATGFAQDLCSPGAEVMALRELNAGAGWVGVSQGPGSGGKVPKGASGHGREEADCIVVSDDDDDDGEEAGSGGTSSVDASPQAPAPGAAHGGGGGGLSPAMTDARGRDRTRGQAWDLSAEEEVLEHDISTVLTRHVRGRAQGRAGRAEASPGASQRGSQVSGSCASPQEECWGSPARGRGSEPEVVLLDTDSPGEGQGQRGGQRRAYRRLLGESGALLGSPDPSSAVAQAPAASGSPVVSCPGAALPPGGDVLLSGAAREGKADAPIDLSIDAEPEDMLCSPLVAPGLPVRAPRAPASASTTEVSNAAWLLTGLNMESQHSADGIISVARGSEPVLNMCSDGLEEQVARQPAEEQCCVSGKAAVSGFEPGWTVRHMAAARKRSHNSDRAGAQGKPVDLMERTLAKTLAAMTASPVAATPAAGRVPEAQGVADVGGAGWCRGVVGMEGPYCPHLEVPDSVTPLPLRRRLEQRLAKPAAAHGHGRLDVEAGTARACAQPVADDRVIVLSDSD